MTESVQVDQLARQVGERYAALPAVEAVAMGGSRATGWAAENADIDLYVYVREPIPMAERHRIATGSASRAEVGNEFWEPGDEWIDLETGIHVDVMFRELGWIQGQLDRVLVEHQASVGYSTCFWHNVLTSRPLFDRNGWFAGLQERAEQPYPDELRRNVVAKNYPILRDTLSSYRHQIQRAIGRRDLVSVNHRLAAFLASYFDILFALNRQPHPGEKRLVEIAVSICTLVPDDLEDLIETMLSYGGGGGTEAVYLASELIDRLDPLLRAEELLDGLDQGFDRPSP